MNFLLFPTFVKTAQEYLHEGWQQIHLRTDQLNTLWTTVESYMDVIKPFFKVSFVPPTIKPQSTPKPKPENVDYRDSKVWKKRHLDKRKHHHHHH